MKKQGANYFLLMGIILLILVVIGFSSRAYLFPDRLPPARLTLYFHIIVTGSWFILFIIQSFLIRTRNHKIHMRLGWFGTGLAVALVISGVIMIIENNMREFLWIQVISNSMNMLIFSILFAIGVYWRSNLPQHKRMMIFASMAIMSPALARLSYALIGNPVLATPIWLGLLATVFFYDRHTENRVTQGTWLGVSLNLSQIVAQIATLLLASPTAA